MSNEPELSQPIGVFEIGADNLRSSLFEGLGGLRVIFQRGYPTTATFKDMGHMTTGRSELEHVLLPADHRQHEGTRVIWCIWVNERVVND